MMKTVFAYVTILLAVTFATAASNDQEVGVRLLAPHEGCSSDDYSKIQALLGEAYHHQQQQRRRNLRSQQQQYIEPRCQFICAGLGERCSMVSSWGLCAVCRACQCGEHYSLT